MTWEEEVNSQRVSISVSSTIDTKAVRSREQSETWFEVGPTFVVMLFCALPHYLLNKPDDTAG